MHPLASASIRTLLLRHGSFVFPPTRIVAQRLEESVGIARAPLLVPLDVDVEPALQERLVAVHAEQRLAGAWRGAKWQCEQTEQRD